MQAMKLLALSGVMAAAGAMISLTFAVSPPLIAAGAGRGRRRRQCCVATAAATETFEGRIESTGGIHWWSSTNLGKEHKGDLGYAKQKLRGSRSVSPPD